MFFLQNQFKIFFATSLFAPVMDMLYLNNEGLIFEKFVVKIC